MLNSLNITLALIKRHLRDFEFKVFRDTPVTPLSKPLNKCRAVLITTGGLHLRTDESFDLNIMDGDSSFRKIPVAVQADEMHIAHKWYNHKFINADLNCVFPIDRMREYVDKGTIGSLSKEHYSFMGHIYKSEDLLKNSKKLGRILKDTGVDIAFLTPTWVLCNQAVGLIARNIEKAGISTVCISFRKEITELSGPPRIVSTKFSPGKPLGKPGDRKTQRRIIEAGFRLLQSDIKGTTTIEPPY